MRARVLVGRAAVLGCDVVSAEPRSQPSPREALLSAALGEPDIIRPESKFRQGGRPTVAITEGRYDTYRSRASHKQARNLLVSMQESLNRCASPL